MAKKKVSPSQKKKSHSSKRPPLMVQVGKEIWPLERDVLFRPDRFKYVRKLIAPTGCVFCLAAKEKPSFETLCVHKSEHSMVILNKFPYNSGHLLVIPKRHAGDLLKLSEAEFSDLHNCLKLAIEALQQVYQPGGMNVGLNLGAVAGAGIPDHVHYHVIPRWAGDLNFFPLVAETKTVIESLEMSFDRLVAYFKGGK
ncbi:MAG: HIT domain-containing protein [Pseudobdellovibrionaceae bacterium]